MRRMPSSPVEIWSQQPKAAPPALSLQPSALPWCWRIRNNLCPLVLPPFWGSAAPPPSSPPPHTPGSWNGSFRPPPTAVPAALAPPCGSMAALPPHPPRGGATCGPAPCRYPMARCDRREWAGPIRCVRAPPFPAQWAAPHTALEGSIHKAGGGEVIRRHCEELGQHRRARRASQCHCNAAL